MKNNRIFRSSSYMGRVLLFGILSMLIVTTIPSLAENHNSEENSPSIINTIIKNPSTSAIHDRITISGNDWTSCDIVTGLGTSGSPFVIADQIIDLTGESMGTAGIAISSSSSYGLIENCTIFLGSYGISFFNTINVEMRENIFIDLTGGISISGTSPQNLIIGNNFTNVVQGISISKASNSIIHDNIINGTTNGITLYDSHYCDLDNNNIFASSFQGFKLDNASYSVLSGNNVYTSVSQAFQISDSIDIEVIGGQLTDGSGFEITTSDNIFISNYQINNSNYGIEVFNSPSCTLFANNITNSKFEGIILHNSPDANITKNRIIDTDNMGIVLDIAANSIVNDNFINNSGAHGIHIRYAQNSNFTGNIIINSTSEGLYIWDSPDCNFIKNNILDTKRYGVYFMTSPGCNLIENNISSSGLYAVFLLESHSCLLNLNNLSMNLDIGFLIIYSDLCIISENKILKGGGDYCISLSSDSDNNQIFENYFIKNDANIIQNLGNNNDIHDNYYIEYMIVSFTSDNFVLLGELANFTATPTEGNPPLNFFWNFGDGTNSTEQNPSHNYAAPGIYTANCTVTDSDGDTAETTMSITVEEDVEPIASFNVTGSTIPDVDEILLFTDTSTGGNGDLTYSWDFGDSSTSTLQNPTHSYDTEGIFIVTLTVTDADGDFDTNSTSISVVDDLQPTVTFTVSTTSIYENDSIMFTSSVSGGDLPLTYLWVFGDGVNSTESNPIHIFETAGSYTPSLTVTDVDGDTDTYSIEITVTAYIVLSASFSISTSTPEINDSVSFTDTSTGGKLPLTYLWDFGDSETSTLQNPTHSYNTEGNYTVTLTVTDRDGEIATYTQDIMVIPPEDGSFFDGIPGYPLRLLLFLSGLCVLLIYKSKKR